MGWERVDLAGRDGVDRQRCWRSDGGGGLVTVGQLADGRWFAEHSGKPGGAYVFHPALYRKMCDLADRWLADGRRWTPAPTGGAADTGARNEQSATRTGRR